MRVSPSPRPKESVTEPLRYDSVQTPYAVGLDVLACLAGTTRDAMEDMNPAFFRGVTPPDRRVWVKVPVGTADSVAARLAVLPATDRVTVMIHIVGRGETMASLARRYGVTATDIRSVNHLPSTRLARGQRLVIPASLGRLRSQVAAEDRASTTRARTTRARAAVTASRTPSSSRGARRMHIVRPGESPYTIASSFGVPVRDLLAANGMSHRSVIRPGQSIRIPN